MELGDDELGAVEDAEELGEEEEERPLVLDCVPPLMELCVVALELLPEIELELDGVELVEPDMLAEGVAVEAVLVSAD